MPWLSIIVPTRRLDDALRRRVDRTVQLLPGCELLIVEPAPDTPPNTGPPQMASLDRRGITPVQGSGPPGRLDRNCPTGSSPYLGGTASVETHGSVRRLNGPRGRGTQCNAGARAASAGLLLFLHDDTDLPTSAADVIGQAFRDPATEAACFRLSFDHRHPLLSLYAWFSRFDSYLTSFGDQGILIRRTLFDAVGGFPDWPLFEDVELLRRARRHTRIRKLPATVTTSAVRFIDNGIIRQQVLNASLILRFTLGAKPEALYASYERRRGPKRRGPDDL
jgi:hypothetical protein